MFPLGPQCQDHVALKIIELVHNTSNIKKTCIPVGFLIAVVCRIGCRIV